VLDEEKGRLKNLLIASIVLYILSWIFGLGVLKPILYDFENLDLLLNYPWLIWVLTFVTFTWIPVSLWLLWQAVILRRQMKAINYEGDKSIATLSIALPIFYWVFYILSRILQFL
jgi:hypothetical protein